MENLKVHFNNLIAAPERQDVKDAAFLQEQALLFPYCQSLKLALARLSTVFKLKEAGERTSTAAIYAPDRVVLFNLIGLPVETTVLSAEKHADPEAEYEAAQVQPAEETPEAEPVVVPEPALPEPFESSVYSVQYASKVQSRSQERSYQEDISVRKTFLYWLKKTQRGYFLNLSNPGSVNFRDETPVSATDQESDPLERNYQIATFRLEESDDIPVELPSELIRPDLSGSQPAQEQGHEPAASEDQDALVAESGSGSAQAAATSSPELGMVTETLAAIYYQQKLYSKALQAYDDLTLKFPNKSAYFAGLQEKIRKELIDKHQ